MKARSDVRETVADLSSKYTRAPCYLHSEDTPSTQPPKDKFFTGDKEMPPKPFNGCSFDKIKQGFCRPAKEPLHNPPFIQKSGKQWMDEGKWCMGCVVRKAMKSLPFPGDWDIELTRFVDLERPDRRWGGEYDGWKKRVRQEQECPPM